MAILTAAIIAAGLAAGKIGDWIFISKTFWKFAEDILLWLNKNKS